MESKDSHEPEVSVNHFVILYLNFSATKIVEKGSYTGSIILIPLVKFL